MTKSKSIEVDITTALNLRAGCFEARAHRFDKNAPPILSMQSSPMEQIEQPTVRVHSACLFGEAFDSQHCDCGHQLRYSLSEIRRCGGVLIYLPQEGRGAGICMKILGMEIERLSGKSTVEAFQRLGLQADLRSYERAFEVLRELGSAKDIRMITNNPHKIEAAETAGFNVVERVELELMLEEKVMRTVQAKQKALGHFVYK